MKKRILIPGAFILAIAIGVVSMSAFEAHVINVTAKIENALSVLPEHINFGTVFPEEVLVEPVTVSLSESFLAEDDASGVDYVLKQKPKPRPDIDVFPGEVPGHEYCLENYPVEHDPADIYWTYCYPSLCPYLSKHLLDEGEGDVGIPALHDPGITILEGLRKQEDITDSWDIDLLVPCFEGQCAQDGVIPPDYQLPSELESQVFGCDLWFEVTGIYRGDSAPPTGICQDIDLDQYGVGDTTYCTYPEEDCDDSNDAINPGTTEDCDDGVDNDCDGDVDCADNNCDLNPYCLQPTGCSDNDNDLYGVGDTAYCTYPEVDCDDTNDQVFPGASETCNNVDDDCDTQVDENLVQACYTGNPGTRNVGECHDGTETCTAGAWGSCSGEVLPVTEVCNDTYDNDCDGFSDCDDSDCSADAACTNIQNGDLVITEIMQNPSAVSDTYGEWFEIYNNTASTKDLQGCVISDLGSDSHTIATTLDIPAYNYVVLGRNADTNINGGVSLNYSYGSAFTLGNTDDEVIITCDSTEIDRVEYDDGVFFPDPAGASMILAAIGFDNNIGSYWCVSTSAYGDGDSGTPGAINDPCQRTINFSDLGADPQYGYVHDYSGANASFTYNTVGDDTISGTFSATGLKPYATYQLKFEAKPTCAGAGGDDAENELIGLKGRWWNDTDGVNLNSDPTANDTYYYNNSDYYGGSKCIIGYLVWSYVTADISGNVSTQAVTTDSSYHVLRCGGSDCGIDTSGADDAKLTNPDSGHPNVSFCAPADVNGELERFTCGGLALSPAIYTLNIILNEESFHTGNWTAVMNSPIEFGIY